MKKIITLAFILFSFVNTLFAQDESKLSGTKLGKKDGILLNLYTDLWQSNDTSVTISSYSPGFDIYTMYNIPFGKSKFSFGFGLGIGTHNMRSDAIPLNEQKWDTANSQNVFTGNTVFSVIPEIINNNKIEYDNNKFTLTYFDIPIELRFRTECKKGKTIKFSVGGKFGYLLSSHTKYRGTKYIGNDPDVGTADVKYKTYKISNLELLRYGLTARFGVGLFNVFGYYSLSQLFEKDKGPEMYPISVGVCITPF